jgi:hypothetical protein
MSNVRIYLIVIGAIMFSTAVSASDRVSCLEMPNIRAEFDDLLKEVPEYHFFSAANMRKLLEKYSNDELELSL